MQGGRYAACWTQCTNLRARGWLQFGSSFHRWKCPSDESSSGRNINIVDATSAALYRLGNDGDFRRSGLAKPTQAGFGVYPEFVPVCGTTDTRVLRENKLLAGERPTGRRAFALPNMWRVDPRNENHKEDPSNQDERTRRALLLLRPADVGRRRSALREGKWQGGPTSPEMHGRASTSAVGRGKRHVRQYSGSLLVL